MPFDGVEVSEVMERLVIGRARIEAGWCQGRMYHTRRIMRGMHREYCMMGAVWVDLEGWSPGRPDMVFDLLVAAIAALGYGRIPPVEFNDSPGRTKAEVIDVCDVAIAMLRGEPVPPIHFRPAPMPSEEEMQ